MTHKSKRELEQAVEDLSGDADAVHEWADRYLDRTIAEHGFDVRFSPSADEGATHGSSEPECIPIQESRDGFTFFAPRSAVPDWIDSEDLPVDA